MDKLGLSLGQNGFPLCKIKRQPRFVPETFSGLSQEQTKKFMRVPFFCRIKASQRILNAHNCTTDEFVNGQILNKRILSWTYKNGQPKASSGQGLLKWEHRPDQGLWAWWFCAGPNEMLRKCVCSGTCTMTTIYPTTKSACFPTFDCNGNLPRETNFWTISSSSSQSPTPSTTHILFLLSSCWLWLWAPPLCLSGVFMPDYTKYNLWVSFP